MAGLSFEEWWEKFGRSSASVNSVRYVAKLAWRDSDAATAEKLKDLIGKLREQAHEMESPFWTKEPEQPDWAYVAKAFRKIADELAKVIAERKGR